MYPSSFKLKSDIKSCPYTTDQFFQARYATGWVVETIPQCIKTPHGLTSTSLSGSTPRCN